MAGFPSFLRINNIPMYVCIYLCIFNNLLIYLSMDGHLGCCCILAVVNNAAWTWRCRYLFKIVILFPFLCIYTQKWDCWIPFFWGTLFFWETFMLFSIVAVPTYISTNSAQRFPLCSCQYLLSFSFLIIIIITGVRWYLTDLPFPGG